MKTTNMLMLKEIATDLLNYSAMVTKILPELGRLLNAQSNLINMVINNEMKEDKKNASN